MKRLVSNSLSRRHVLGGMAGAAALSALGGTGALAMHHKRKLGVQLYSVRNVFNTDPEGTLKKIAEIGYSQVEFAGLAGKSPTEMRAILDGFGLTAPSAHMGIDLLKADLAKAMSDAKTLGCKYVVLPWLAPEYRTSKKIWQEIAAFCNEAGQAAKEAGIGFAYHNHDFEFFEVDGIEPMHVLISETDPELVDFEIDFFWTVKAGHDPLKMFEHHPGRFKLCHVKDMDADGNMANVGEGTIDFASILAKKDQAGLKYFFVERDDAPEPYFPSIETSFKNLSKIKF